MLSKLELFLFACAPFLLVFCSEATRDKIGEPKHSSSDKAETKLKTTIPCLDNPNNPYDCIEDSIIKAYESISENQYYYPNWAYSLRNDLLEAINLNLSLETIKKFNSKESSIVNTGPYKFKDIGKNGVDWFTSEMIDLENAVSVKMSDSTRKKRIFTLLSIYKKGVAYLFYSDFFADESNFNLGGTGPTPDGPVEEIEKCESCLVGCLTDELKKIFHDGNWSDKAQYIVSLPYSFGWDAAYCLAG